MSPQTSNAAVACGLEAESQTARDKLESAFAEERARHAALALELQTALTRAEDAEVRNRQLEMQVQKMTSQASPTQLTEVLTSREELREEMWSLRTELRAANTACEAYKQCASRAVVKESDLCLANELLEQELTAASEARDYFKQMAARANLELVEHWCSSEQDASAVATLQAVRDVEQANDELEFRIAAAELALSQKAEDHERQLQDRVQVVEEHIARRRCSLHALEVASKVIVSTARKQKSPGPRLTPRLASVASTGSGGRAPSPPPVPFDGRR